jgi:hypothetical protein
MRFTYKKGLTPTSTAEELRFRFEALVKSCVAFLLTWVIAWFLIEFVLGLGDGLILAIPILFVYVWACVALGRLASCFGESASSWALSTLFFNGIVLVLAYFAFGEGVRRAYAQTNESPD